MIVAIWLAVPALLALALGGWGIERALRWDASGAGHFAWVTRVATGLALVTAALLHPVIALLLLALLWLERRVISSAAPAPRNAESDAAGAGILGLATLLAMLRPPLPIAWDEHVWLAKVRLGPLALRAAALDPASELIPRGYPIVASLGETLFALGRDDVPSLVAGAAVWWLVVLAIAITALPASQRIGWALALAAMPLVWVHARLAYLDLPVGVGAVAIAAALARGDRWALRLAMCAAFLVAGSKDEGVLHVLAIAGGHALLARERWRESLLVAASALLALLGWRTLIAVHGVINADHALAGAGFARLGDVAFELARAAWDLRSWGIAWPLALGCALAARRVDASAERVSITWALQLGAMLVGVLIGGERLLAFALGGTLANRVWMQLAPMAALLVATTLARAYRASSTSKTAQGCHSG